MKKIKILFFLFTNIKTGAGTEKTLYQYLKYADTKKFDITVMETNLMPGGQRLSDTDLKIISTKAKFVEVKDYIDLFNSIQNKFLYYFFNIMLLPTFFKILKVTKYRTTLKRLGRFEIIYLFDNHYSNLFSRDDIVIASNHCDFNNPNSLLQKIYARLISLHIIFPSVKAIHLFSSNMSLEKYFSNIPVILLNNGVDTELYYPKHNENERLKMLFVGRLEKSKGISMVLSVYRILKDKLPVELIVVGSGSLECEVDNLCRSDRNVSHFKHVSEKELAEIYRSCDIFVYPTLGDTFALVVMEALSSGLKVVTSNFLYETYKDFIQFDIIKFIDFDELSISQAVIDILKTNIDKNAVHNYIKMTYSWENLSTNLFDYLTKLVGCVYDQ